MNKVYQTIVEPGRGNCFAACLASLLEFPLNTVPNFRAEYPQNEFHNRIQEWLERFNLMLLRVRLRDSDGVEIDFPHHPLPADSLCIASGKSPRWKGGHAVVGVIENGNSFRMLHDPFGEDAPGIEKIWTLDFLVPKDPAKVIRRIQLGD